MTERIERINSLVQQEVGYILQHDIKDARLGFVTVLRAEISKDLRNGRIFVGILDDPDNPERKQETIDILNKSAGYIQKMLGARIRLRYMPKLRFIFDDVVEHSIHIQKLLKQLKEDDQRRIDME
ncbi:MAG: 30S ribosome-binding factor RbfA [Candidatus Auribacterota bacterium]|jgi:ribosome-binding factor A|nr:30S ribosome-binding factor RbfA [Candidatus Auribacterota bacterium]